MVLVSHERSEINLFAYVKMTLVEPTAQMRLNESNMERNLCLNPHQNTDKKGTEGLQNSRARMTSSLIRCSED
jgi:hypothetical protein